MNFVEVYNWIGQKIAAALDKLKVKNPIVFLITQAVITTMGGAIMGPTIDLPNWEVLTNLNPALTTDAIVGGILLAVVAALGPRTSALKDGTVVLKQPKADSAGTTAG